MKKLTRFYLTTAFCALVSMTFAEAKDVIAKVNGREITKEQRDKLKQSLPPQVLEKNADPVKLDQELTNQLVDLTVLIEAARNAGVEKKPEVKEALENSKDQVLVQAFIFDQLKSTVNEEAIQAKYKEMKEKFPKDKKERKVRHILVKEEKEAKAVLEKLIGGQDFQKLAREFSIDKESAKEGGDLGYYIEGSFVPEFEKAANDLQVGKYTTAAVKTQFGYHIIKLEDVRVAKAPKFEDIKQQLMAVVQQEAMIALIKKLRDKANVEIFTDNKARPSADNKAAAPAA